MVARTPLVVRISKMKYPDALATNGREMDAILSFVIGLGSSLGASVLGGLLTASGIESWYRRINKPKWTPPDWVFGPVWLVLYLLMGASFALVLMRSDDIDILIPTMAYAVQLALNIAWNWFFFAKRMLRASFFEIAAMWAAILLTVASFAIVNLLAALLLVPYLAWVSIASALNFSIWRLNSVRPTT